MSCLRPTVWVLAAGALAACGGSSGDGGDLPTAPPESATMVASGGFDAPMDAVASPDGSTFYFTATDTASTDEISSAALFSVAAAGGDAAVLHSGEPLEDPSGLLMSCDGSRLFVSDLSYRSGDTEPELEGEKSPVYTYDIVSGQLSALEISGVGEAAGLALGPDCETLYISGYTEIGEPALFTVAASGGTASVVASGSPLESPSGVFVDADSVAWVMDQLPSLGLGGALYAITADGTTSVVIDGLDLSEPAGVSLTAGGGTAVIASRDEDGRGQLVTVGISSGATTIVESNMVNPAGLRTARQAGVFAIADTDGDAIYRAE